MTRGFARILVPTDFSPPSDAALATAKALAAQFGASIHVIHVLYDPYATPTYASDVFGYLPSGLKESWRHDAQTHLDAFLTPAERAQFRVTTSVIFGSPATAIVEYARENAMNLIVMGTHGRGFVAHLLLGSVAERVVRTAECPVLTVRGTAAALATLSADAEPARAAVWRAAADREAGQPYSTLARPNFSMR
jgi:nucleotide-binding universal stress UspA family protein